MHIVVNTLSVTPNRGGVKTYLLNLLDGLLALDEDKRITLLCSQENEHLFDRYEQEGVCVEKDVLPLHGDNPVLRILFDQIIVPLCCQRYNDAVLLSQASVSSLLSPLPEVVIVQVPLSVRSLRQEVPEGADNTSWFQRLYYDTMLPLTLWRTDQVVAVSDYLREKIAELYPRAANKLRTVHEGVNLQAFTSQYRARTPETSSSYMLFVSTLFPYKRADQAIRAFARATMQRNRTDLRLKLAGKDPGHEAERLRRVACDAGIENRVDVLGAVPHAEMPSLYRNALALLFPSTVETFGLPILEAMASGTPVIASNRMSVSEVVGEAGITINPDDIEEFTEAISQLLEDDALRKALRKAGRERAQKFSWERTARSIWEALEDAKE